MSPISNSLNLWNILVVIRLETTYNVKANIYKCTTNLLLQFLSPRAAGDKNLIY